MAKSLAERITSARSSKTVRLTDLEALIAEAEAERARLANASVAANADSVDFALSDADRDEAAAKADRFSRTVKGLDLAIVELRERLEDLRNTDERAALEAEKNSVLTERDQIAALIRAEFPGMIDRLVEILTAAKANSQRMKSLGIFERDAESEARDIMPHDTAVIRFETLKLPRFGGAGRAWPEADKPFVFFDVGRAHREAQAQREREHAKKLEAAAEHARSHGRYRLSAQVVGMEPARTIADLADKHGFPRGLYYGNPWEGELPHAVASQLGELPNLIVEALQPEAAK